MTTATLTLRGGSSYGGNGNGYNNNNNRYDYDYNDDNSGRYDNTGKYEDYYNDDPADYQEDYHREQQQPSSRGGRGRSGGYYDED
eukprot:7418688-Ditylum_brightwellii.AAC.1